MLVQLFSGPVEFLIHCWGERDTHREGGDRDRKVERKRETKIEREKEWKWRREKEKERESACDFYKREIILVTN